MKTRSIFSMAVAALCLSAIPAMSAELPEETNRDTNGKIVRGPYLTNGFWDNWFIDLGAGPGIYLGGLNDNFGDRIGAVIDLNVGKWLTPSSGVRLSFNYTPKYKQFSDGIQYDFYNWNLHADFLWNMLNTFGGYKTKRVYQLIPFIGGGIAQAGNSNCFTGRAFGFALDAGLINKFRVCDLIDLNLEIRGIALSHTFDRISNDHSTIDAPLSVTGGITFNLGNSRFQRASTYAAGQIKTACAAKDAELATLAAAKAKLGEENSRLAEDKNKLAKDNEQLAKENERLTKELAAKKAAPVVATAENAEELPECIVFFDFGKTVINDEDEQDFKRFANYVSESIKAGKEVTLIGSADKRTGSKAANKRIAEERVKYVKDLLVTKYNIPGDKLKTVAAGSENNRFQTNKMNRCVYVKF